MPSVRISDPKLLDDLTDFLQRDGDAVVARTGDDSLLVQIVGSYGTDAMRMVLDLRLRAWEEAQRAQGRAVTVQFVED